MVVDPFCICMWQGQKCNPSLVPQQFWCLTPSRTSICVGVMNWDLHVMYVVLRSITVGCRVLGGKVLTHKDFDNANATSIHLRTSTNVVLQALVQNHSHAWLGCTLSADPTASQDQDVEHRMQVVSESFWANTPHKNVSSALMFRHLILL